VFGSKPILGMKLCMLNDINVYFKLCLNLEVINVPKAYKIFITFW
jgi:hypothetical protein